MEDMERNWKFIIMDFVCSFRRGGHKIIRTSSTCTSLLSSSKNVMTFTHLSYIKARSMHTLYLKVRICHKAVPKYITTKDSLRQQHELRPRSPGTRSASGWKQVSQVDYAHRGYTDTFLCTALCDRRKPETENTFSSMCVWSFSHCEWKCPHVFSI